MDKTLKKILAILVEIKDLLVLINNKPNNIYIQPQAPVSIPQPWITQQPPWVQPVSPGWPTSPSPGNTPIITCKSKN